jgi:hypothetical protein
MTLAAGLCGHAQSQSGSPVILETLASQGSNGAIVSDPTIRPFQAPGMPANISTHIAVDLRGNGRPDIFTCYVAITSGPDVKLPCRFLRPQPDGSVVDITRQLLGPGALPSRAAPRGILVADFNGDGRPDIFIAAHGWDAPPFPGETNVLLLSNPDGTYTDRSASLPQTSAFTHSACVGDVNGDGKPDIYVGSIDNDFPPYLLLNKGNGEFEFTRRGLPATIAGGQETFLSCLLVDVNGDGSPDLVLGSWPNNPGYGNDSIILFNDGNGDFTTRPRYVLPPHPIGAGRTLVLQIMALDINRDGRPDLVLLATPPTDPATSGYALQMLINRGDGSFVDETASRLGASSVVATGSNCGFFNLADLNGDGWPDFFCIDGPTFVARRYWMSNGNGTWSPVADNVLPVGFGMGVLAVDFDGDGRPDLVQFAQTDLGDIRYKSFFNRTARAKPRDCLFEWAERNYPQFFSPAGGATAEFPPFYYRFYAGAQNYLATSKVDNHIWVQGPMSGNNLADVGPITAFANALAAAGCFP